MTNWAANLEYTAASIHHPETIEQLQEVVAGAAKVKALGSRHSFSAVADTPGGALVSLDRLPTDLHVDTERSTVSITGGTTYSVLAAALERRGLALANLASLPHVTVAGATATATHGSGDGNGVLSSSVAAVEVITADGSLVRVDRTHPDHPALAAGLGAFGVIARIELDIEPTYQVRQDLYRQIPWETALASLDDMFGLAYSVSLMLDPGEPNVRSLWLKRRDAVDESDARQPHFGGEWWDGADIPADSALEPIGVWGPWSQRMAHFRPDGEPSARGDELQSAYCVDRRHGRAVLEVLRSMGDRISPHVHGMEIRTLAGDELWMSPGYRRDSLSLGFTWRKHPDDVLALLPDIETALAPFDPRPHFGKLFAMDDVSRPYPRLADFFGLVDRYDSDRTFWNPFLERIAPS